MAVARVRRSHVAADRIGDRGDGIVKALQALASVTVACGVAYVLLVADLVDAVGPVAAFVLLH